MQLFQSTVLHQRSESVQTHKPGPSVCLATEDVIAGARVTSEIGATLEEGAGGVDPVGAVMELVQQARELGRWAAEEMGVPVAARAPESTLRR
jgi:hypothetical protein